MLWFTKALSIDFSSPPLLLTHLSGLHFHKISFALTVSAQGLVNSPVWLRQTFRSKTMAKMCLPATSVWNPLHAACFISLLQTEKTNGVKVTVSRLWGRVQPVARRHLLAISVSEHLLNFSPPGVSASDTHTHMWLTLSPSGDAYTSLPCSVWASASTVSLWLGASHSLTKASWF